ncbi:unnamed protein product, partial [marine sediment metagenome]
IEPPGSLPFRCEMIFFGEQLDPPVRVALPGRDPKAAPRGILDSVTHEAPPEPGSFESLRAELLREIRRAWMIPRAVLDRLRRR